MDSLMLNSKDPGAPPQPPSPPTKAVTQIVEPVVSICGTIVGCIQGYVSQSVDDNLRGTFQVEVVQFPEMVKKTTVSNSPNPSTNTGDFGYFVEWAKLINMNCVFSYQQIRAAHLKLNLLHSKPSSSNKRLLGSACLDISSLVTILKPNIVVLPVFPVSSSITSSDTKQCAPPIGWIVFGCYFIATSSTELDASGQFIESIQDLCSTHWMQLKRSPFLRTMGWSATDRPEVEKDLPSLSKLHVGLGKIQGYSSMLTSNLENGNILLLEACVAGCDCPVAAALSLKSENGLTYVGWNNPNLQSSFISDNTFSLVVHFRLTMSTRMGETSSVIGETFAIVPHDDIKLGVPINLRVMIRDRDGYRLMLVYAGFQVTCVGHKPQHEAALVQYDQPNDCGESICLKVLLEEGSVSDPSWKGKLEPFFDVSLFGNQGIQASEQTADLSVTVSGVGSKARSRIVNLAHTQESWGIELILSLPADSLPKTPSDESSMSRPFLLITCRDAARFGCPDIGWSKISIPWSLVCRGKEVDQWVTLTPARGVALEATTGGTPLPGLKNSGRVKVHLAKSIGPIPNRNCQKIRSIVIDEPITQPGLGTVVLWIRGAVESRAGSTDEWCPLSLATAAADVIEDPTTSAGTDDGSERRDRFSEVSIRLGDAAGTSKELLFSQWGALPVPSGLTTEITLNVSVHGNIVPYSTKFSVMEALSSCDRLGHMRPVMPRLELTLKDSHLISAGVRKTKKPPKLIVDAAFVPFVGGKLIFSISEIHMMPASASRFSHSNSRVGAIRYVLSSRCYTFSPTVTLDAPITSTVELAESSSRKMPGLEDNAVALQVDTLGESVAFGESSFEVQVYLLDIDSADPNSGSEYCVGVGTIQTAHLYFLALRSAAASAVPKGLDNTSPIGCSPWLQSHVTFVDPIAGQVVAVASISAMFVLENIASPVIKLLRDATADCVEDPNSKARTELGLKQAFILADTDQSGSVSRDELLKIMKGARSVTRKSKSGISPGFSVVGMEDAVGLIASLAGQQISKDAFVDPNQLGVEVKKIFKRLDVDGDGHISWWEWQSVLSAALNGHKLASRFVHPYETLAISIAAAQSALGSQCSKTENLTRYLKEIPFSAAPTNAGALQEIAPLPSGITQLAGERGKTVDKLQYLVKSLRVTNTSLNNRLEKALMMSSVALASSGTRTLETEFSGGMEHTTFDRNLSYFNLSRTQSSASPVLIQSTTMKSDKETALELEISRLKALLAINNQMKSDKDVSKEQKRQKLVDEVDRRKQELEDTQRNRREKMRAMLVLIRTFQTRWVPKYRKKVYRRSKQRLAICLRCLVSRHKFIQLRKRRWRAAVLIQKLYRGRKIRIVLSTLVRRVLVLQRVVRGHHARQIVRGIRRVLAELVRSKRVVAAVRIQSCVRRLRAYRLLVQKRQQKRTILCATRIQSIWRRCIAKKELTKLREKDRLMKKEHKRHQIALSRINQAIGSFILRRRLHQQELCVLRKNAAVRIQGLIRAFLTRVKLSQLTRERHREEAATTIQAVHRGRLARKFTEIKRKNKAHQQFLMGEFDRVAKSALLRPRPAIAACVTRIVRFCFPELDCESPFRQSGWHWGRVANVNEALRLAQILFYDPNEVVLFPVDIPFDHPELQWFALPGDDDFEMEAVVDLVTEPVIEDQSADDIYLANAVKVQRYVRGSLARRRLLRQRISKYWTALQGLFHDSVTKDWTPVDRPSLESCQLGIVRIIQTQNLPALSSRNRFQTSVWGRVQAVNLEDAELILEIFDPNKLAIYIQIEPYNSPCLNWYRAAVLSRGDSSPIAPERSIALSGVDNLLNTMITAITRHEIRDDTIEAKEVDKPGVERVSDGYYISYSINGTVEKCGNVRGIDLHTRLLSVGFYCDGVEVIENVPYDHPFIIWYKEVTSTVTRPRPFRPRLNACVGFEIAQLDGNGKIINRGTIVDYKASDSTINVRFRGKSVERKIESFDFDNLHLVWMHSMRFYSKVIRPPLHLARGYTVYCKACERGTLESDYYVGIVQSIDMQNLTMTIRYERDDSSMPVVETMPYDSPDVAWMQYPSPASSRSIVIRPPIEDSVGYSVEIVSALPNADEGDYFQGIVTGINQTKGQILVRFSSTTSEIDVEWYPYESSEIVWVAAPVEWISSRVPKPELSNAVGYRVALRKATGTSHSNEVLGGIVKFVDLRTNTFTVQIEDEDEHSFPITRICNYESKDVAWMCKPIPDRSLVPKPHFQDAVGYTVDIRKVIYVHAAPDVPTPMDSLEFTRGIVVSLNPELLKLVIRIITRSENNNFSAENTVISYNSGLISWMAMPPMPILKSLVPRPSKVQDSIGYVVEVPSDLPNAEFGDYFRGEIVSASLGDGVITINFEHGDQEDSSDVATWKFTSDKIIWISPFNPNKKSAVARPNLISDAMGYSVCIRCYQEQSQPEDLLLSPRAVSRTGVSLENQFNLATIKRGIVTKLDELSNSIFVRISKENIVRITFTSENVLWMASPSKFFDRSIVVRPESIKAAVGCKLHIASKVPGADYGDFFCGIVSSVDTIGQMLNIRYHPQPRNILIDQIVIQSNCPSPTSIGQPSRIPFHSWDISWVGLPLPANERSIIPKPVNILDAPGFGVQIASDLPNAEEGDFFSGIVSHVDPQGGFIFVCFDARDHKHLDIERMPFDSSKVSWTSSAPTLDNVVGCRIGMRDAVDLSREEFRFSSTGFVVGVISCSREIVCILSGASGTCVKNFVLDRAILPFDWLSLPDKDSVRRVPIEKPNFAESIGYIVHLAVDFHDEVDQIEESVDALVVGLDEAQRSLRVRFFDGIEMDEEVDLIPFASSLTWSQFTTR